MSAFEEADRFLSPDHPDWKKNPQAREEAVERLAGYMRRGQAKNARKGDVANERRRRGL